MNIKFLLILLPLLQFLLLACQPENKVDSSTNNNNTENKQSTDVAEFEGSQVYQIDIKFCGKKEDKDNILFADENGCFTARPVYHWVENAKKKNLEAIMIKKYDFSDSEKANIVYTLGLNSQGCFRGNPIPNQEDLYTVGKTQVIVDPSVVNGGEGETWNQGIQIQTTKISRQQALQLSRPCKQIALNK